MQILDVRGLSCPIPVLEVKKKIDDGIKELKILADCGTATENIERFAKNANLIVAIKELDDGSTEFILSEK